MHDDSCIGTIIQGLAGATPVTLSIEDLRQHMEVIGKTGTGKSTLLSSLIHHALEAGNNFALLDPLGGLAEAIVDAVPAWRNDHTIYFDPGGELEHCLAFNPLDRVPPDFRHLVADHLVGAFMHIWNANLEDTPRLVYVLYNSLRLLLDTDGSTLLGLPRLLVDNAYRAQLLKQCHDPVVLGYWHNEFAAYDDRFRAQVIGPIQNKIGMLLAPPALRNILGQKRSTIDIARLMNQGGILITCLAKGKLGATGAHLLGAFLATTISQVAQERIRIPLAQRRDFTLYCDEVQNFATSNFASTLSEARQLRLSVVMAHQFISQLPDALVDAIFGNCGSLVVFRTGSSDGRRLADELDIDNYRTLGDTGNHQAWVKLMHNGAPTSAMLMRTLLSAPPAVARKAAVVAHTRARHTRPRAVVEKSIAQEILGRTPGERDPAVKARLELAAMLQLPIDDVTNKASPTKHVPADQTTARLKRLLDD
jgi:hypothetical protein